MNMQSPSRLAPHEMLDLHEILSFKNTCATKAMAMQSIVSDQELKGLISQDITNAKRHMQELNQVLHSVFPMR